MTTTPADGTPPADGPAAPPPQTSAERTAAMFDTFRAKVDAGERVFPAADDATSTDEADDAALEDGEGAASAEAAGEAEAEVEDSEAVAEGEVEEEAGDGEDEAASEEDGGGEGGEPIIVKIRGRDPDEELELEVPDQATADHINRLNREGLRREELRAAQDRLAEDRAEIEEIDVEMATDPAGFLLSRVSKDYRVTVAKALLLDADVFEAVEEELSVMAGDDRDAAELARRRNADTRREAAEAASRKIDAARSARTKVRAIATHVADLVPSEYDQEKSTRFQRAALLVAEELAGRRKTLDLTRDEIVAELQQEGLLDRFGIKPGAPPARRKGRAAGTRGSEGESARKPAGAEPDPSGDVRTPAGFKKARLRRKAVAGSASSGAGAPAASIELPSHGSVNDRIEFVRKHGMAAVLRGKKG